MSVDVTDRDKLKTWLKTQPREVVVSIAVRSALRVFPLLAVEKFNKKTAEKLILPSFRAIMIAWEMGQFPEESTALKQASRAAIAAAATATANATAAGAAADAYAYAVVVYTATATAAAANTAFAFAVATAADAAAANTAFATAAFTTTTAAADADAANADAANAAANTALYFDVNVRELSSPFNASLLWETEKSTAPPIEIVENWEKLKTNLLSLNPNWHVWTDWYEARLYPDKFPAPNKKLELARAMIPQEIWNQGWEVVNPHIEKLIAEHTPRDVGIGPSAYHFYADDGVIRAQAVVQSDDLNELCVELYDKTKHSLEQALENESPNQPLADWLKTYIHEMQEALGKSPDDVKPGQLLFVSKDIDADNAIFQISKNQDQIAFSDQRLLNKMGAWLDELLPCLEKVRAHEAAKLALGIQRQDAEKINAYANEIIESASQSSIVDKTAIIALKSRDEALAKDKERMASEDERIAEQGIMDYAENVSLKVLENRNFIRRSLDFGKQELKEISGRSYQGAKDGFVKGIEKSTTAGVVATLSMAVGWLNPIAGMALLIASFRKDEANVKSLVEESNKLDVEQEDVSPED